MPKKLLDRFGLVQKECPENKKVYKDVLIYRKGYRHTELDKQFISALSKAKDKYL